MKRIFISITCFLLASIPVLAGPSIPNFNFEKGTEGWAIDAADSQIVGEYARSEKHSLRLTSRDISKPSFARTPVQCVAGHVYQAIAWVRTDHIEGRGFGAVVGIEWLDAAGKVIGVSYSKGLKKSDNWIKLSMKFERAPAGTASGQMVIGITGATGRAWFDLVTVRETSELNLYFTSILKYPNYHETIYPGKPRRVSVGIALIDNDESPISGLKIAISVNSSEGKYIANVEKSNLSNTGRENFDINIGNQPPGEYQTVVKLIDKSTGSVLQSRVLKFRIAAAKNAMPRVYIDEYNRCVVEGKLFFPIGFYTSTVDNDMAMLKGSKFNCIMDYNSCRTSIDETNKLLDSLNAQGLKLIFSIKHLYTNINTGKPLWCESASGWTGQDNIAKGILETFKDHPAVLAWYINDELDKGYMPQLTERYNLVRKLDPNHPVWDVLYDGQDYVGHMSCSDILGIDNYPVFNKEPLEVFGNCTRDINDSLMGSRAIWMVPQGASIEGGQKPAFNEVIVMSYDALINGARGLVYYTLAELRSSDKPEEMWATMKRVGAAMDRIKPIALGHDVAAEKRITVDDRRIHTITRTVNGKVYVLVANPSKFQFKGQFKLGQGLKADSIESTSPGRQSTTIQVKCGLFVDTIESYGVRVYRLKG